MYALRPVVEYNTADSCAGEMNDRVYRFPGSRKGKVAAGIWPWKCRDALLQYNACRDTRLNQDGMAWDADSGDGTVYQYNFSRLNEGGCVMFCLEEAVHNTFCHNVSYDDLGGTVSRPGTRTPGFTIMYFTGGKACRLCGRIWIPGNLWRKKISLSAFFNLFFM